MKKNKIFIALQNYELPNPLANYGVQLAKKLDRPAFFYGVEKIPIHTEPTSIMGTGMPESRSIEMQYVKDAAEIDLKHLYYEFKKIYDKVEYAVEIGFPESSIISKTEDELPYLVTLESNHELTTLHEWFGTYETRLAENIEAPVLVIPKDQEWKPVNRILYIMDMNDHKVENLRFLSTISKELKAQLAVVVISDDRNPEEDEKYNLITNTLRNFLGYTNINFHRIFTEESADTVERLMNHVNADWLAFEHRSRSFLERMLDDYNTKRLILQSETPVLVF